ncbi:MAG: hypothetical protein WBZ42_03640 [Halobacteriota archaeon]
MVTNLNDLLAINSAIIDAAQSTIVWLAPQSITALFVRYRIFESVKTFLERGGSVRGITYAVDPCVETVRALVRAGAGADIRHTHDNPRKFMLIGDDRESVSSFHVEPERLCLESPIVAFWTDEPNYAQWLLSSFEAEWTLSVNS